MLCYCKKCGRIILFLFNNDEKICDCCKAEVLPVPKEYLSSEFSIKKELEQQFIDKYIKSSPEFDQELFDHKDEILAKQSAEFNAKMEHGSAVLQGKDKGNPYGIICPNCKATNVRKITVTNKAIHTSVFGIWSIGRNAKNYHCDHCGSEF